MAVLVLRAALPLLLLTALANTALATPLSTKVKPTDLVQRQRRDVADPSGSLECVEMTGQEGNYWHISTGSDAVCGLYVIGEVDSVIEVEVTDFNIDCEDTGLLALVDGWELQGELFPSPLEVAGGLEAQYRTFCGPASPPAVFISSQNVALVQFRVPRAGQGFRVNVRFLRNPAPCNVMAPFDSTAFTLKNFGLARNCTVQIVFPVNVLLVNADVRATSRLSRLNDDISGLSTHCHADCVQCGGPAGTDFVAFQYGTGLDTAYFDTRMAFCGRRSKVARRAVTLGCSNSAIRLQSSGLYYNSVTVEIATPTPSEAQDFLFSHPHCAAFE